MSRPVTPIFADEPTAAWLLNLNQTVFASHVGAGNLPPAEEIAPGVWRWRVATLEEIGNGNAARPNDEDFEL